MTLSVALMAFTDPGGIITAMTDGAETSLMTCVSLMAVYCVWMGFINIIKDCGVVEKLSRAGRPLIKKLFGKGARGAADDISLNISANLLGAGNAATPPAISAVKKMDRGDGKLTRGMAMLFVVNACGLQIVPATVVGLRAAAGSAAPASVILPCLAVSVATTTVGIILVSLFYKEK